MALVQDTLVEQVDEALCAETGWPTLAEQLDVDRYQYRDNHPEWREGTPFRPMFLAYLWASVEDESLTGIPTRLEENPELAEAFGFNQDDLPSESTCRPVRLENRFEELTDPVKRASDSIRELAAERGAPIGYDLGTLGDDEDTSPSKRTIQRLLRRKGKDVMEEIKSVVIPSMALPRPEESVYDKEELLTLEAVAAINNQAANGAGEELGDSKNPDPDLDDPYYEDGPSGEPLVEALKQMSVDEIAKTINFALKKTYTRAKPRLNQLDDLAESIHVAIDVTYVGYYGDREGMNWVQGTPEKNDKPYDWCHKFATVVIVGQNTHYTVGVVPLGSAENAANHAYPGEDQSYYRGDVVRKLLDIASEFVDVRMVYADREFHAVDVIRALEEAMVKYVIPAKKDDRVGRICERFDQLKKGYADDKRDTELHVNDEYAMYGPVKGGRSNERVETGLVVLPPDEDDDTRGDSPQPFLTNTYVSDLIALDRRETRKHIDRYSHRGAIENSYSSIKECAAWTTSKEFEVRWFHFGFGCIVYNMWLLTDFLVQDRITMIETLTKPRIPLCRFLTWLKKAIDKPL